MQTRKLGNSDLNITPVGYGAWAVGGSGWQFAWGSQDDNDSIAAIHRALEIGVNWIDTAAVYGLGHSEEVVARALKSWQGPKPYVFTKCGLRWDARGNVQKVLAADSIVAKSRTVCAVFPSMGLISTRCTGLRIPILRRLKKVGPPWPTSNARERCAGSASRTSTSSN